MTKNEKSKKLFNKNNNILLKNILIPIIIIILIILFAWIIGSNSGNSYSLTLNGESRVTIYKGSIYNDPGVLAYDDNNNDLSSNVEVSGSVNTKRAGKYIITYKLDELTITREVNVVERQNGSSTNNSSNSEKKHGETKLILKGRDTVYLDLYTSYDEEGFTAIDSVDGNLHSKVKITHNIDNKTPGTYHIVYSVKNSAGITTTIKRTVVVMKVDMTLSLSNYEYTNQSVGINVEVSDEYFDYLVLPNGTSVASKTYLYNVSQNGTYKFKLVNKHGVVREADIKVENIDKTAPSVQCSASFSNNRTTVSINASDNVAVSRYVINGKSYSTNVVSLDSLVTNNNVSAYDSAGNVANASCTVSSRTYIEGLSKDGVIVTVKGGKINSDIAGYYFNYSEQRPDKSSGKFIATGSSSLDIVRLPGNTYVWIEDTKGNITGPSVINITNDALLITKSGYNILQNMTLESYLSASGWSIAELDKLIARSVRAAGLYSKDAAATAGVAMQTVLAQKYKIKMPYWWGGKSWTFGADKALGTNKTKYSEEYDVWYYYYGLDCSGFAAWAYVNAGYEIKRGQYPSFWGYSKYALNQANGDVGDFILNNGHVKLIVGKTDTGYICAEASGKSAGMCLSTHPYSNSSGYWIAKGDKIAELYPKYNINNIPTGI